MAQERGTDHGEVVGKEATGDPLLHPYSPQCIGQYSPYWAVQSAAHPHCKQGHTDGHLDHTLPTPVHMPMQPPTLSFNTASRPRTHALRRSAHVLAPTRAPPTLATTRTRTCSPPKPTRTNR